MLPWAEFDRLNKEREEQEEPLFANPRNAASGTLKQQNPAVVAARKLDAYFYYLLGEELPAETHFDNLEAARSWGFKIPNVIRVCNSLRIYTIISPIGMSNAEPAGCNRRDRFESEFIAPTTQFGIHGQKPTLGDCLQVPGRTCRDAP